MKTLKIILILLSVLTAGIIIFWSNLNSLTKESLKKYGSEVTKTALNIEQVELSLIGNGKIIDIELKNPKDFSNTNLFEIKSLFLQINPFTLFKNTIVVENIEINKPIINFEFKNGTSNLEKILLNINKFQNNFNDNGENRNNKSKKKLIIKNISVRDATLKIKIPKINKNITLGMSPLLIKNIGLKQNGIYPEELAVTIANKLLQEYLKIGNERILNFKNKTNQIKEKFNNLDAEIKDKLKKELNEKIEDIF